MVSSPQESGVLPHGSASLPPSAASQGQERGEGVPFVKGHDHVTPRAPWAEGDLPDARMFTEAECYVAGRERPRVPLPAGWGWFGILYRLDVYQAGTPESRRRRFARWLVDLTPAARRGRTRR